MLSYLIVKIKMLSKYLILLLVIQPAFTYAGIVIKIKLTKNGDDTTVEFLGEDLADITDKERALFKIDDEILKNETEKFIGKRCTNVFLKPPTPWGDVYKKYGWDPVKRNIKPIEARVIGVNMKPVTVGSAEYVNSHNSLVVPYNTSLTQQVNETVQHTWSTGGKFDVEQEITYEITFAENSVEGSTTMSYTSSWGEDTTKSRSVTLGTTSITMTEVPPGNSVVASLIATQGTVDIEIRYSIDLTGKLFCNYEVSFHGHHFYAMPIHQLHKAADTPLLKYFTEKVSVGFYNSVKLEVTNRTVS
ncbi:unnamed protein product [Arctia plantaginis]|uniref:Yolk protein 1 n=1 Tax=Arctia plantaginis TaxID=874455 RepID=A0A8S0ZG56_ARCPL|nr:unnamed protein product [Arctia plantaginis]